MSSTAELISLLDIEAEELALSTRARTNLGLAVRSRGTRPAECIAMNVSDDAFTASRSTEHERKKDLEVERLKRLLGRWSRQPNEGIVWTRDENRRRRLDSLVEAGGEPFGWIKVIYDGTTVTTYSAPFPELDDDPTARVDLRRICRLDPQGLLDCVTTGQGIKEIRYFESGRLVSVKGPAMEA
jgi:hypothetical protein